MMKHRPRLWLNAWNNPFGAIPVVKVEAPVLLFKVLYMFDMVRCWACFLDDRCVGYGKDAEQAYRDYLKHTDKYYEIKDPRSIFGGYHLKDRND